MKAIVGHVSGNLLGLLMVLVQILLNSCDVVLIETGSVVAL